MDDGIDITLLERYLAGESSPEERMRVQTWMDVRATHAEEVDVYRQLLNELRGLTSSAPETDALLRHLNAVIDTEARPEPSRRARRSAMWGVAALVMALAVVTFRVVAHQAPVLAKNYATAAGEQLNVTLADGTRMTLAPETRVQVGSDYGQGVREIQLHGEAYFTVVHDPKHPFRVRTENVVTTDVGTAFDIRAYDEDRLSRVIVTEGAVTVAPITCLVPSPPVLSPCISDAHLGDVVQVDDHGLTLQHAESLSSYTAWLQGGLTFEATPLRDVLRDVGRTFAVKITLADSALAGKLVTADLSNQPLSVVIEAIARVTGAKYEQRGRAIVLRSAPAQTREPSRSSPAPLTTAQAPGIRE